MKEALKVGQKSPPYEGPSEASDSHAICGRISAETWRRFQEKLHNSTFPTMSKLVGAILEFYIMDEPVTTPMAQSVGVGNDSNRPLKDFVHNPMCSLCVYRKRG